MIKKELIKKIEPDIKAIHTESRREHNLRIQQEGSMAKKRKPDDTTLSSEDEDQPERKLQDCAAAATFLIRSYADAMSTASSCTKGSSCQCLHQSCQEGDNHCRHQTPT